MHEHRTGAPVQFFAAGDVGAKPQAALITDVHDDPAGTVCLIAWCPETEAWHAHADVPHHVPDVLGGAFWFCPDEADEAG